MRENKLLSSGRGHVKRAEILEMVTNLEEKYNKRLPNLIYDNNLSEMRVCSSCIIRCLKWDCEICDRCGNNFNKIIITKKEKQYLSKKFVSYKKRLRTPISKTKRKRIYERDGYACLFCGEDNKSKLSIDHIKRVADGGDNNDNNLRCLCGDCNSRRHKQ